MNKMNMKLLFLIAIFFVVSLIASSASDGAEFTIRPSIDLIQEYNDNIFLSRDNRESDFISRVMPALNMNYRTPFWHWQFDYALNWWYYHKVGKSYDSHSLNLTSDMNIINNFLFLNISDVYSNVALDERRSSSEDNLNVNRTDTNSFTVSPYIKYRITPVITLTSGYRYTNIWYREEGGINRQVHTGYATVEYIFSPSFNASAGVEYTADRPEDPEPDNNRFTAFVRGVYVLSPRTNFDGTLGQRWIDFSNSNDSSNLYYNFGIIHRFYQTGEIELRISSDVLTSAIYGVYESRSEELTVRYGDAFRVEGSVFHRKGEYSQTNRDDEAMGITTSLEYRPDPRLTFRLSGSFEKIKFMPEDQTREGYRASGEVSYQLTRRANLILRDTYTIENGRTGIEDYKNNIIAVQLRIAI